MKKHNSERRPARSLHWSSYPVQERSDERHAAMLADQLNCQFDHHWPRDLTLDFFFGEDFHTPANLSRQQRTVLVMIAAGSTPQQIRDTLHIGPATYYVHCSSVCCKLRCWPLTMATARHHIGLPPKEPREQAAKSQEPSCAECRSLELGLRFQADYEAAQRQMVIDVISGKLDPKLLSPVIVQSLLRAVQDSM